MCSSREQLHALPRARLFHSALSLTQGHWQVCTGQKSSKWATTFTVQAGLSCYTYIIYNREMKRRGQSLLLTKLLSTKGHAAEKAELTNSHHPPGSAQHRPLGYVLSPLCLEDAPNLPKSSWRAG